MKYNIFIALTISILALGSLFTTPAHALSCLPVEMYLESVIGQDDVVIFTGTATKQNLETDYTSEVVTVSNVAQGYVESEVIVYHQKMKDWGYLCNAGPAPVAGKTGTYIATRDDSGKYNVSQRLETNDPLLAQVTTDLEKADITGELVEVTATDRANQILSTINDLFREIGILISEYRFWLSQK